MESPYCSDYDRAMGEVLADAEGWELDPALLQASCLQEEDSVGYKIRHKGYPLRRAVSIVFHPTAFDFIDGSEQLRKDARESANCDLQALCKGGWTNHHLIEVR
jgi:hypothetical protein